jgi:hypothetical protein
MATYVGNEMVIQYYDGSGSTKDVFLQKSKSIATSIDYYNLHTRTIAAGVSDEVVSMGDIVTGKFIYVDTDQQIVVKLTDNPITVNASGILNLLGDFTSIKISNSGASDATVTIGFAGASE